MRITFWGAAREVTGSRHLVQTNRATVLLDCGLFQGRREESFQKNRHFGFEPERIDAVVLSHAHIDHSGMLPGLRAQGYRGRVHATPATADLCGPMLLDSAHIQEKDSEFVNRRRHRRHNNHEAAPLYSTSDAMALLERLVTHGYHQPFEVAPGIQVIYRDAGHMLGSATVELRIEEKGAAPRRLVFSGDWGRRFLPVLRDPEPVRAADFLIMESTYGDRIHPPVEEAEGELASLLGRVFEQGGKVIIPAFAVGRTQEIVYALNNLFREGRLPRVPVFVDSPLAVEVTEIFNRHPECYDDETREVLNGPGDPFGFKALHYVRSVEESKSLNSRNGPFIIVSASGMAESGRVLHHLRNSIGDPRNLVLLVGFQAEHTLGRRLQEKAPVVKIFGEETELKSPVTSLEGFSGHGDRRDLVAFATGFTEHKPAQVCLVHGEPDQQEHLAGRLRSEAGYHHVEIPGRGQTVVFD